MKQVISFSILFLSILNYAHTQEKSFFSLSAKGGTGYTLEDGYVLAGGKVDYFKQGYTYGFSVEGGFNLNIFGPHRDYTLVGVHLGKYKFIHPKWRYAFQGGMGYRWGQRDTEEVIEKNSSGLLGGLTYDYKSESYSDAGFILQTGIRYLPTKFLGIGLDLQANLFLEEPMISPSIVIEVGRLR
ncbi:hypothetical protein [Algivirga pacifica]|uniref:Outer membrane protein beta-barrel domain-containing protein n=1 Tax=Algivirga pacifica TaxID=1162670 RepID=A0ABP9DBR2_9BACT